MHHTNKILREAKSARIANSSLITNKKGNHVQNTQII